MKMVVDMERRDFEEAIKIDEIRSSIEFFLAQEFSYGVTIEEYLNMVRSNSTIEISDTVEYDVDKSFARLLDKHCIPYSRFIIVNEDNSEADKQSILDAKCIFDSLDVYSEFQGAWTN